MSVYYEHAGITILHGDSRELIPSVAADVLVTDPPYGIDFESGWTGSAIENDGDLRVRDEILALWGDLPALVFGSFSMPEPRGTRARLVWHRPGSGMGDLELPWKPDFEAIYVLGQGFHGRTRESGVLVFAPDAEITKARLLARLVHPHRKPVALMRYLIERCPPGVIVDPFMGSGSTLRAAKDCGRRAVGIEIEERYCELAANRMRQEVFSFDG